LRLPLRLLEIGPHRLSQLAEMRPGPLPVKQKTAELLLQQLDGARQGRLRHVALLGRAGEVELLAEDEEVSDLVHFHRDDPWRG
jgi:hypothetical protein